MVTVVLNNEKGVCRSYKIYDTTDVDFQSAPGVSLTARVPSILVLEGMVAGSTFDVQVRTQVDAAWQSYQVVNSSDLNSIIEFNLVPFNFVRVVRTGTSAAKIYAQEGILTTVL